MSLGQELGIEIVSANAIYLATIWAIPAIIAITFHEAAHASSPIFLATTPHGGLDESASIR
jgi:hypothetical protein